MAKDHMEDQGYEILGGYFSPVSDGYGKKGDRLTLAPFSFTGLAKAADRVSMIDLALEDSEWIMCDTWEARKSDWYVKILILHLSHEPRTETIKSLDHFNDEVNSALGHPFGKVGVKLICGSDLLDSFNTPGLWADEDVLTYFR